MTDEQLFKIVKTAYPAALRVRHGIKVIAAAVEAAERERINELLAAIRAHWIKANGEDSMSVSALDVIAGVIAEIGRAHV
jgi:hypothetical protein